MAKRPTPETAPVQGGRPGNCRPESWPHPPKPAGMSAVLAQPEMATRRLDWVAGHIGFEPVSVDWWDDSKPPHGGIKIRCFEQWGYYQTGFLARKERHRWRSQSAIDAPGIVPRRLSRPGGALVVTARDAVANRTEDPDDTYRHPACAVVCRLAARGWWH